MALFQQAEMRTALVATLIDRFMMPVSLLLY